MPLVFNQIDFINLSTDEQLRLVVPPESDLNDLALRLRPEVNEIPPPPAAAANYEVGTQIPFQVANLDTLENFEITAELIHRTGNAYAWVEVGQPYDNDKIIAAVNNFSQTAYPAIVDFFGSENNPGIDNDPRLHILHSAQTGSGAAGYFSRNDSYSKVVNPFSNEKEMFYINLLWLNGLADYSDYENVLAHEFQHMVHFARDASEANWIQEGLSEFAIEIAGLGAPTGFLDDYTAATYTSLTSWYNSPRDYGAAYLFITYLAQRFGNGFVQGLIAEPSYGIESVSRVLQSTEVDETLVSVFGDWIIANYVDDPAALGEPSVFGYEQFDFEAPTGVSQYDTFDTPIEVINGHVSNFAVNYIVLEPQNDQGAIDLTLTFSGTAQSTIAFTRPASTRVWWSNDQNGMDARLTRQFDFRQISPGTPIELTANMWWDIEEGYDYGYALVSEDGVKWQTLQGLFTTQDNPTGANYGSAYNGRSRDSSEFGLPAWVLEKHDLSDYAGKSVWIRFEYITDEGLSDYGWFIDDIQIPAIGYSEDFENGIGGWMSEGWLLTDNTVPLPQNWLVQLFTLQDNRLEEVFRIPVDADGNAQFSIPTLGNGRTAVMTISGTTLGVAGHGNRFDYSITQSSK